MSADLCPCCQRPMPRAKAKLAQPTGALLPSDASDAALFAFYRKIGTREDCRFWLDRARVIPDSIRADAELLLVELGTRDGKPADAKRLSALKMRAATSPEAQIHPCGHRHTMLSTAVACYAGVPIPPEGETPEYREERDALLAAMGWTGYQRRRSETTETT